MRVMQKGLKGPDVKKWQYFLIGQGFDPNGADGDFGDGTYTATVAFQKKHALDPDGKVGHNTMARAMQLGFKVLDDTVDMTMSSPNWPPKPDFSPLVGTAQRQALFGKFAYKQEPVPGNYENIRILDNWESENIVRMVIPQLKGKRGVSASGAIRFHRLAAEQMKALWAAWESAGLLDRVLSWGGSFVPRLVRGSATNLSNHAFGTAFDINVDLNPLGAQPPLVGRKGSVRELVPLANEHGFYWGGHYANRADGMHFEVAVLKG